MKIGDKAPEILGKDEQGRDIRLSDYKGRKLVLYFYPKDNTSGCTAEARRATKTILRQAQEPTKTEVVTPAAAPAVILRPEAQNRLRP